MDTLYKESQERINAFNKKINEDSHGNCIRIPVVYLQSQRGCEGNARHLVHDFFGRVMKEVSSPFGSLIEAQIPPSSSEEFEKAVKEAKYIPSASIQTTSTNRRTIKLNS